MANSKATYDTNFYPEKDDTDKCPVKTSKKLRDKYKKLYEKAEETLKKLESGGL